jgi:predicted dehydrogenase
VVNRLEAIEQRFLVIGCGSIGKRHIENLRRLGANDIIAFDTQALRAAEVAAAYGVQTVVSLDAAWQQHPNVCLITAPTSLHLALALKGAARGCHLFIEKPLSHSWQGVEELLDVAACRQLVTLVGCNMRFHPGLRELKRLLAANAVGRVITARAQVGQYLPDWHPLEDYRRSYSARRELGGGVILDAIHEIDYLCWLFGPVADAVCLANKLSQLEIDTEDTAAMLLRFNNGVVGEVHLDYVQRIYRRTCQIIGEEGTIDCDFGAGQVRWYSARSRQWSQYENPAGWEVNQMYFDEMKHFLSCLAGEGTPELEVAQAAQVLRIALAAKQSAAERQWIRLEGLGANAG